MEAPPLIWSSVIFPDFVYLNDPRESPEYEEEARQLIAGRVRVANDAIQPDDVYRERKWPNMRLERALIVYWDKWDIGLALGTRIEHHTVRYLCHLIPSIDPDPWFQEKCWAFHETRALGKQITNLFGGQSSGKSTYMAALANGLCALHPALTRATLSNPYKDAGEYQLWNETQTFFAEIKSEWGEKLAQWTGATWDKKRKVWDNNSKGTACLMEENISKGILRYSQVPNAGTIRLVAMDKVGKTQGGKAKDRRQKDGFFLMLLDEISAGYATTEFIQMLYNLKSNDKLHVVTGCNPKNPIGQLDGELGRPPNGYESLKIDESYVWNSGSNSRTYRFDGHRSPNIVLGEDRWPWLFNERKQKRLLAACAMDSDAYNGQCRGFMPSGSGNQYVLTSIDIRDGQVDREFEWTVQSKWRCAFFDPALTTDGDNAVYTLLEGGTRREIDNSTMPVVYAVKQLTIPVFTGKLANEDWIRKHDLIRGKGSKGAHTLNQLIPVEEQLALDVAYQMRLDNVPFNQFGYDDSMRSRVMTAMLWAMGDGPRAVSSVGDADDTPMYPPKWDVDEKGKRHLVTWRQDCQKFVSQVYFFGAAVVRSNLFRCHPSIMVALNQACQRFCSIAPGGKKRVVESKKTMKERNSGQSPDNADSLFGALYIANKLGFLQLKIDLPNATEHLLRSAMRPSTIAMQWKKRRPQTGLYATGTRG